MQERGQNDRNRDHEAKKDIEFQEEFMRILEYTLLQRGETVGLHRKTACLPTQNNAFCKMLIKKQLHKTTLY